MAYSSCKTPMPEGITTKTVETMFSYEFAFLDSETQPSQWQIRLYDIPESIVEASTLQRESVAERAISMVLGFPL